MSVFRFSESLLFFTQYFDPFLALISVENVIQLVSDQIS